MAVLPAGEIPQNPYLIKKSSGKGRKKSKPQKLSREEVEKLKGRFSIPSWMIRDK